MNKILKPDYYDEFNCIANECEEHCCAGWRVDIDKGTFNKYRKLNNKFSLELNKHIKRNRKSGVDSKYAKIELDKTNSCPMLDEKGLCNIHKNIGADYLSHTCKNYPRSISRYNEVYELSLTMSCPEVARKIILNNKTISFNYKEESGYSEEKYFREYADGNKKLYGVVWELRSACIFIIQYREIPLWKRIIFITMMCDKIQPKLDNNSIEECYDIIAEYKRRIFNKDVVESLDSIISRAEVKIPLVKNIIAERNKIGVTNKIFNSICINFDESMGLEEEDSIEELAEKYIKIEKDHYIKFIEGNEYVMENYLVYYIFSNFMRVINTKDIYKEIVKLVINYSMIRMLLTGKLAYHKEEFTEQNLIEVFYSFSRTVEHSQEFLEGIYKEMKELGYINLAYLVILIK